MWLRGAFRRTAETAIAAREDDCGQGGAFLALFIGPGAFLDDHGALIALVEGARVAALGGEGPFGRQRLVQLDLLTPRAGSWYVVQLALPMVRLVDRRRDALALPGGRLQHRGMTLGTTFSPFS